MLSVRPLTATGQTAQSGGLRSAALCLCAVVTLASACGRGALPPGPVAVALLPASGGTPAVVRVTGLSTAELSALRSQSLDESAWQTLLMVSVAGTESLPVAGAYRVAEDRIEFVPRFGFDPGRQYRVRFDPGRLPTPRTDAVVSELVGLPAPPMVAATTVTGISPSGVWPENLLRFYIYFSGPMSRTPALGFLRLEDSSGREVKEAFLPLDADLWNGDRTRFTVFFDPGRVKRGIRPNVERGRALHAGRKYAIVIDRAWPDTGGQPLVANGRFEFSTGPAEERAIDPAAWRVETPRAGTRNAVIATFPWPLDRGLLQRGISVADSDGAELRGSIAVTPDDRRWQFAPFEAWRAGRHELVVLAVLEDPAGNRVGRPFEIEMFRARAPEPTERVQVPFVVK